MQVINQKMQNTGYSYVSPVLKVTRPERNCNRLWNNRLWKASHYTYIDRCFSKILRPFAVSIEHTQLMTNFNNTHKRFKGHKYLTWSLCENCEICPHSTFS